MFFASHHDNFYQSEGFPTKTCQNTKLKWRRHLTALTWPNVAEPRLIMSHGTHLLLVDFWISLKRLSFYFLGVYALFYIETRVHLIPNLAGWYPIWVHYTSRSQISLFQGKILSFSAVIVARCLLVLAAEIWRWKFTFRAQLGICMLGTSCQKCKQVKPSVDRCALSVAKFR